MKLVVNDRHPAGEPFPADPGAEYSYSGYGTANHEQSAYGSYGTAAYADATQHDGWSTGSYDAQATGYTHDAAHYGDADPLYGHVPGGDASGYGGYPATAYAGGDNGAYGADGYGPVAHDTHGYANAGYDTSGYEAAGYGTNEYSTPAYGTPAYDTGAYDTTAWTDGSGADYSGTGFIPHQVGPEQSEHGWSAPAEGSVQWDVSAFDATAFDNQAMGPSGLDATAFGSVAQGGVGWDGAAYGYQGADTPGYDATGYDNGYGTTSYGTGAYDTTPWTDGSAYGTSEAPDHPVDAGAPERVPDDHSAQDDLYEPVHEEPGYDEPAIIAGSEAEFEPGAAVAGPPARGRRRSPKPRRSALLTVAAPSVAVLGVAGIAAASVIPAGDEDMAQAVPDTTTEVKASPANSKLDTQLAGLREAGDDFADRASRTQERIDLKKRQEAERKRKAAEAARREALRPKFALPVEGAGISAYFGQAGINWMSVHTGLDFPVSYGTPVMAATDGTVRTQWNPAYGNMMIVTSADGTETWYCHLSSTRIRTGTVKAGDVIGYSGNSGNSTGPHLHFEVRPGGGSAIDPLSWFRSHGLEPS